MELLLASASPRRKDLLSQCGIAFRTAPHPVDEQLPPGIPPQDAVALLSRMKAKACAVAEETFSIILGADTLVAKEGLILGKPHSKEEATEMLKQLSGAEHQVFTGVTLLGKEKTHTFVTSTSVRFYSLTDSEIEAYVKTGEPMDKAGAYGIQGMGGLLVEKITGDYYNIVGLPIARLVREMKLHFPDALEGTDL